MQKYFFKTSILLSALVVLMFGAGIVKADNPTPSISSVIPNQANVGSADVPISVIGNNFIGPQQFLRGSDVLFDGSVISTTYVSANRLNATIPSSDLQVAGVFPVTVNNNNGAPVSNAVNFTVVDPDAGKTGIRIVKNTLYGDASFGFTVNPGDKYNSITTNNATGSTLVELQPGTCGISEYQNSPWKVDSASCDDATSRSDANGNIGNITVTKGHITTYTFTNEKLSTITVTKVVVPATDSGQFALSVDGDYVTYTGGNGESGTKAVTPGSHTVSEYVWPPESSSDYTTTYSGNCDANGNITTRRGAINYTCTITNTRKSTTTNSNSNSNTNTSGGTSSNSSTTNPQTTPLLTSPITLGQTSPVIAQIQTFLIGKGYSLPAGATGYFGSQTKVAFGQYEKDRGLSAANPNLGVRIGPWSWATLIKDGFNSASSGQTATSTTSPASTLTPNTPATTPPVTADVHSLISQLQTLQGQLQTLQSSTATMPTTSSTSSTSSALTSSTTSTGTTTSPTTSTNSMSITPTTSSSSPATSTSSGTTSSTSTSSSSSTTNPVPTITSISPSSGQAGTTVSITVNGTNFVNGASVVIFNGVGVGEATPNTTFLFSIQLSATWAIPANFTPGTYNLAVVNPNNGQGSNDATFTVTAATNPVPTITSISPTSGFLNSAVTITVYGTNFINSSVVSISNTYSRYNLPTTFISSTKLQATIPASYVTVAGTYPITVTNPAPGGGTSNAINFTVTAASSTNNSTSTSTSTSGTTSTSTSSGSTTTSPTTSSTTTSPTTTTTHPTSYNSSQEVNLLADLLDKLKQLLSLMPNQ